MEELEEEEEEEEEEDGWDGSMGREYRWLDPGCSGSSAVKKISSFLSS